MDCPGIVPPPVALFSPDGFSGGVEPSVVPFSPDGFSGGVAFVVEELEVLAEAVVVETSAASAVVFASGSCQNRCGKCKCHKFFHMIFHNAHPFCICSSVSFTDYFVYLFSFDTMKYRRATLNEL